jgi:hypothetical protein
MISTQVIQNLGADLERIAKPDIYFIAHFFAQWVASPKLSCTNCTPYKIDLCITCSGDLGQASRRS